MAESKRLWAGVESSQFEQADILSSSCHVEKRYRLAQQGIRETASETSTNRAWDGSFAVMSVMPINFQP